MLLDNLIGYLHALTSDLKYLQKITENICQMDISPISSYQKYGVMNV